MHVSWLWSWFLNGGERRGGGGGGPLGLTVIILFVLSSIVDSAKARQTYKRYFLDDFCRRQQGELDIRDKDAVLLQLRSTSLRYEPDMDCWLRIRGAENKILMLKFLRLSLYDVGHCVKNKLNIFENTLRNLSLIGGPYCGYHQSPEKVPHVVSQSNVISLHFACKATSHMSGFTILITQAAIRDRCKPDEFPCNNDAPLVCIKSSLRCDGRDNCGDRKDEATETASCGVMGIRAIVSTLLVIVAILVVGAAFFSLLYRKRK